MIEQYVERPYNEQRLFINDCTIESRSRFRTAWSFGNCGNCG